MSCAASGGVNGGCECAIVRQMRQKRRRAYMRYAYNHYTHAKKVENDRAIYKDKKAIWCEWCGGKLVAIGESRINGKDHADWKKRRMHKKCWMELEQRLDNEIYSDDGMEWSADSDEFEDSVDAINFTSQPAPMHENPSLHEKPPGREINGVRFDPIFPSELARANPLPCDEDAAFQEEAHVYAVKGPEGDWITNGVISITGWIKRYETKNDADFEKPAERKAKEFNELFMEYERIGRGYPQSLYDMIDEADWVGSAACRSGTKSAAEAFAHRLLDDAGFVRAPPYADAELVQKCAAWRALGAKRSLEKFTEIFGTYEPRALAAPPHLIGSDVRALWPRYGTRVHHDIEMYFNGYTEPKWAKGREEWTQFLEFVETHLKEKGYEPFRTELTMGLGALRVCGQLDFLARKPNGKYALYDWKRTDKLKDYKEDKDLARAKPFRAPWSHRVDSARNKYTIQINLYRQMLKSYKIDVDEMYLVSVHKDHPNFQLISVPCVAADRPDCPDARALREMVIARKAEVRAIQEAEKRHAKRKREEDDTESRKRQRKDDEAACAALEAAELAHNSSKHDETKAT